MISKPIGRLRVAQSLARAKASFSLSVGSKETRLTHVNLDIDKQWRPDICGDVTCLPLRDGIFDLVYFTDVIEHLPNGFELDALAELNRVIRNNGNLILSTPRDFPLYKFLDPAYWTIGHRHYSEAQIRKMILDSGFRIEKMFSAGGIWDLISILCYTAFCMPLRRIANIRVELPNVFKKREDKGYNYGNPGYTIFVKAAKIIANRTPGCSHSRDANL